ICVVRAERGYEETGEPRGKIGNTAAGDTTGRAATAGRRIGTVNDGGMTLAPRPRRTRRRGTPSGSPRSPLVLPLRTHLRAAYLPRPFSFLRAEAGAERPPVSLLPFVMKIGVIGTGYVGLVSGTCFAEMGNDVVCVDIDARKVEKLSRGELTIFEPGIERLLERNLREERIRFTTDLAAAVEASDILFLALPAPPGEDGSADLSYVLGVAAAIADLLADHPGWGYRVLVDKSTVPVGTAARVRAIVEERGLKAGEDFDVVSNPEFLREGVAVDDFMKPERVVIGTESEKAAELMTQLYEPFVRSGNPILVMDERSAEMTKYAANSLLATKITFMNEIANVCERVGADVDKVRHGIGTDSRIG